MTNRQKHNKQKRKEARMKQQASRRKNPVIHASKIKQAGQAPELPATNKEQADMIAKWRAENEV